MARLTKADAARQLGISRTTLYKLIDEGKVSPTPDGLIDDAELVRVAPLLDVHRARTRERPPTPMASREMDAATTVSEHYGRPPSAQDECLLLTDDERQLTSTYMVLVDTLRAQLDTMRHELEAARAERQAAHAERQEAREERAMLLQMLQDMQHRYDRLLEAPRPVPASSPPVAPPPSHDVVPVSEPLPSRSTVRQRILAMLREYPEGLTAAELRVLLRADRSLTDTCAGMFKNGLLRRVGRGRYVITPPQQDT